MKKISILFFRILMFASLMIAIGVCLFPYRVGTYVSRRGTLKIGTVYSKNMPQYFILNEPNLEDVYYAIGYGVPENVKDLYPTVYSSRIDSGRTFFLMLAFAGLSGLSYLALTILQNKDQNEISS